MKALWTRFSAHYARTRSRYRHVVDALELLAVVYGSMVAWGIVAELAGASPETFVWPGLVSTLFCVYVIGRLHNQQRHRRIRKLYERVQAEQGLIPGTDQKPKANIAEAQSATVASEQSRKDT